MSLAWSFWIDRGGTFTDVVGRSPSGALVARKVLSEQPGLPGDPAVQAIARILQCPPGQPLPCGLVDEVRLGTTVATNALLEGQGSPVLLLINRGLADLLVIGDQHRPDLFALEIQRPFPLALRVLEVAGRLAADGQELEPLQLDAELAGSIRQAMADGYQSCAVALLHSYRWGRHEQQLAAWLEPFGFDAVVQSHQLCPRPRLLARAQTAVVEAAVAPVLQPYLQQVAKALGPGTSLAVMRSSGALESPDGLHAKDTILSGPAGGMVGALAAASWLGCPVLGFDMGGTSTDVFYADPAAAVIERSPETEIAGITLLAPRLPIHTVAAGGGSILHSDGQRLGVGPQSAGAQPGPACYGRGGPATITDAQLVLGRLPASALPAVFGADGRQGADRFAACQAMAALGQTLGESLAGPPTVEALATGALAIAVERMAEAVRRISIQHGHDIREAVLVCYGGAGGQLGCRLAETLGVSRLLLHPLAGVLSAYGLGQAPRAVLVEETVRQPLEQLPEGYLEQRLEALRLRAGAPAAAPGRVQLELRSSGREQGLLLAYTPGMDLQQAYSQAHQQRFGFIPASLDLVLERLELELSLAGAVSSASRSQDPAQPGQAGGGAHAAPPMPPPAEMVAVWSDQPSPGWSRWPRWCCSELPAGVVLQGPALLVDATTTTVVEPGWQVEVRPDRCLLLQRQPPLQPGARPPTVENSLKNSGENSGEIPVEIPVESPARGRSDVVDPVMLELYNHRFTAIAEQMGVRLQQSARSVNIRERLDFSCAVFDGRGRLVANAPHIPVHLGSMGESVTALLAAVQRGDREPLQRGDVLLSNNPYNGGTHLPDITAITPVFATAGLEPNFYVACRGHHGDVGGLTPGSMPPWSRTIADEGLLLDNVVFLQAGELDRSAWRQRFAAGSHPVRNPEQLLADLQAQVAANRLGAQELERLVARHGLLPVQAYMGHGLAHGAQAVRRALGRLQGGRHTVSLDNGSVIAVAVTVDAVAGTALVDFTGTSPQCPSNMNAPLAVTKAVVLYVFRTLIDEPLPLNAGCFEPLTLVVPKGSILNPDPPAAVVAGNVEVSQAAANALLAALGVMAASQGTMNNLSFGNGRCQYYETICGGAGAGITPAGKGFAGASAVQTHMTNSRITDPEILEARFPVRLERFALRPGSGGAGRWRGGDGVVRQLRFLEPMTVAVLSGSRLVAPFGLQGGEPGQCGRNQWLRAQGPAGAETVELPGCVELQLAAGDALRLETPGGGGFGQADPANAQRR